MDRATRTASDRARRELFATLQFRRGRMRRSLQEVIRGAVQDGRLAEGTGLPASRVLAAQLGVSRGVVTDTYDQLAAEGYLRSTPRAVPVVAGVERVSAPQRETVLPSWRYDMVATAPDISLFPRRPWLRAAERALAVAPDTAFDYGDHRGRVELRRELAGYLARVRGVRADPQHIVIVQGFTQGVGLVCRALRARGARTIAVETPSLPSSWATIRASGLRLAAAGVDGEGLRIDELRRVRPDAVLVTPAHQFPTGVVMSAARRVGLVEWAARAGALVIEDDYDAEFRFDRTPIGAVQGLDPSRVVHIGTASKTLAPGVRLGWVSLPARLVDELRRLKDVADSGSPTLDQLAFAELVRSGDYERHVARMRHTYRRRRDRVLRAMSRFAPRIRLEGAAAGMHVVAALPDRADDVALARAAASRGIRVQALSPMFLGRGVRRGLLLGYGRLPESVVARAMRELATVLEKAVDMA